MKLKIKKGDQVVVTTGSDKGKRGEVIRVLPKESRVVVSGVNVVKKHVKANRMQAGGIENREAAIHSSNVSLIDPKNNVATRVGYTTLEDGRKVRVARKSGETIDQ